MPAIVQANGRWFHVHTWSPLSALCFWTFLVEGRQWLDLLLSGSWESVDILFGPGSSASDYLLNAI